MSLDLLYLSFNPNRHPELLPKVVECYRDVFAGADWNEWKKCSNPECSKRWGIDAKAELKALDYKHCGSQVVDYWSVEKVTSDIKREVTEKSSCWIAMTRTGRVIGFTWGYPISPADLHNKVNHDMPEKYRLSDLAERIRSLGDHQLVAYQDEVGVVPEYRRHGIAKELTRYRLNDFKRMGLKLGVTRTMRTPPSKTFTWYTRDGFSVISEFGDPDDKVILVRSLEDYRIA